MRVSIKRRILLGARAGKHPPVLHRPAVFDCYPARASSGGSPELRWRSSSCAGRGFTTISVEADGATLGDHYGPRSRKAKLSREAYFSSSVAALGVAAHDEVGRAVQHGTGYAPFAGGAAWKPGGFVPFLLPSLMDLGIPFFAGGDPARRA
ncbi:MAG TPA: zinc metallopeptidase [Clostridia bacterium]|nr:zinc metallopeptidase [Clostridia bacterium]